MAKPVALVSIARASPIWGFLVFFGIHNWLLPKERQRSLGCLGMLLGPVFNIYSYVQYMRYEGIYWSPQSGNLIVKNVREVGSFEDVLTLISTEGGLIQISTVKGEDFGNVETSGWLWTKATVEKGGSDSSTPAVIVVDGGGKIRGRIHRAMEAYDNAQHDKNFTKEAMAEAAFQDEVAKYRLHIT